MTELAARRWPRLALAAGLGALAGAGQVPLALWPLTLAALAGGYVLFATATGPRAAAFRLWAFASGYFAASLFWIVEPFMVDPARDGWMAPFALVFMACGLALIWGAAGWLGKRSGRDFSGYILAVCSAELIRTYLFGGFPWAMVGYTLSETGMAQLAAYGGPGVLNMLVMGVGALIGHAWLRRQLLPAAGAAALLVAALAFGGWRASAPLPPDRAQVVRLVQPNAPQKQKWDPQYAPGFFARELDFTAAAPLAEGAARPDLIVWPETSIATWMSLDLPHPYLADMAAAAQGATLVFGINRDGGARLYNSMFVLSPDGTVAAHYDKHHLVPFGEYLPAGWLLGRIGLQAFTQQAGYGFSPGPGPQILDLGAMGHALPLICYEAIFPQDLRTEARPAFLLQITNDAWFGHIAGPQQHLAQTRLRAIEQGLPMVRVANTGISAVIDARGHVRRALPLDGAGWVDSPIPGALPPTFYAQYGDLPMIGLLIVLWAATWRWGRRESV